MNTEGEQLALYLVLLLALAVVAYTVGSEISQAWHSNAQHIEEAIR